MKDKYITLIDKLLKFRVDRGWDKIDHQDYAKSIAIEACELLEHFQWDSSFDDFKKSKNIEEIKSELADILIYVFYLAHDLNIDLLDAVNDKHIQTLKKYTVENFNLETKLTHYKTTRKTYKES